jgi:hypothetical protein
MSFTAQDVLAYLEECNSDAECYRFFIDLEHGYFEGATTYLHLFADKDRWAMVFETAGYGNRAMAVLLDLYHYGNCLRGLPRAGRDGIYECNLHSVELIDFDELKRIEQDFESISLSAGTVRVRAEDVVVPSDPRTYEAAGIDVGDGCVPVAGLVRLLATTTPRPFHATEAELRTHVPADLPRILTIDEWHHRYYANGYDGKLMGERPSSYETYPLLAEVLVSRDPTRWRPRLPANTHWSNWPEAGGL